MDVEKKLRESFPTREEFIDCTGRTRVFELRVNRTASPGYLLAAYELTEESSGYEFAVFAEADPFGGFGRLRDKIRRGLARKYLVGPPEQLHMSYDEIAGHVTHEGIIVDGELMQWNLLTDLIRHQEGAQFHFRFRSRENEWSLPDL